jgi:hypothetical protein
MRALRLLFALLSLVAWRAEAHECETSCSQRCLNIVSEYERIARANQEYCDGDQTECVLRCTARYNDGTCRTYGADYCGRNPVCVQNCTARFNDGTCRTFGGDVCGERPLNCAVNCTARFIDGSCRSFGPDHCGRNATCRVNCTARYPDGTCREYGADVCTP